MIVIIGSGLSGSLLALRLAALPKPPEFRLLESESTAAGNHTWSFHQTDIVSSSFSWLSPLIEKTWPTQEVRFQQFTRKLDIPYHSITSERLAKQVIEKLGDRFLPNHKVVSIKRDSVELESGLSLPATLIFDARGESLATNQTCGYQNFVGLDLELESEHHLTAPIIMDADCEQKKGYRFFYLLPWSSTRILIEDTRYVDDSAIDSNEFESEIKSYCARRDWKIKQIKRKEMGSLPIPFWVQKLKPANTVSIPIGVRGGFFHLTTGYSFSHTLKLVEAIAERFLGSAAGAPDAIVKTVDRQRAAVFRQNHYFALLNRMLFLAATPEQRFQIFERFYKMKPALISKFYAGEFRTKERLRLLAGRPPVSVTKALLSLVGLGGPPKLEKSIK